MAFSLALPLQFVKTLLRVHVLEIRDSLIIYCHFHTERNTGSPLFSVEESDTLFLFVPFPAALSSFAPPASSELICSAAPGLRAAENQDGTENNQSK